MHINLIGIPALVCDIDEILRGYPKNGKTQKMFYEATYIHEHNKQEYREYLGGKI